MKQFRMRSPSHVRANAQFKISATGFNATNGGGTNFRTIGTTLGTAA